MNFKHIHIGKMIEKRVAESGIEISRICNFMKCTEREIAEMYLRENLPTDIILRWSKLLEYDFFRIYSQHLILYSPPAPTEKAEGLLYSARNDRETNLPQFRKSIYTKELIDFILERIESQEMSKQQVMDRYKIPKTTLFKWISKYKNFQKKTVENEIKISKRKKQRRDH